MHDAFASPQAHSAGQSIMGTNLSVGGALAAAGLITVALTMLPTIFTAVFNAHASDTMFNPFNEQSDSFGIIVASGLGLLNSIVDVNLVVVAFFNYWLFRATCTTTVGAVCCGIRFMVGL